MIKFKTIKWKNFLSTGNTFIEYDFCAAHTTLIAGSNGSGKSTLLDALVFALFGVAFRKIKKANLINSINKKCTEVELEFSIGNTQYKINRGIRPDKFDLYVGGVKLESDSNVTDRQKTLENTILKLNYKSFCQIVILGSSNFIPFMKLSRDHKRLLIEDILELKIFSQMKKILKGNIVDNESIINNYTFQLKSKKNSYETIDKMNKNSLEDYKIKELMKHKKTKKKLTEEITTLNDNLKKYNHKIKEFSDVSSKIREYENKSSKLYYKTKEVDDLIKFLIDHDNCPVCTQTINEKYKTTKIETLQNTHNKYKKAHSKINNVIEELNDENNKKNKLVENASMIKNELNMKMQSMSYVKKSIDSLTKDLNNIKKDRNNLEKEKDLIKLDIDKYATELDKKIKRRNLLDTCNVLLKDEIVKAKVIEYYLPIINGKINQILHNIGLYIKFNFDGDFNETIESRCIDNFNYESFSEGEKARIDIAILLALNYLAKTKNSINTNILLLDEIFDSSLDREGSSSLNILLKEYNENTKITVISHIEHLEDKFDRYFNVKKINNFTNYEQAKL